MCSFLALTNNWIDSSWFWATTLVFMTTFLPLPFFSLSFILLIVYTLLLVWYIWVLQSPIYLNIPRTVSNLIIMGLEAGTHCCQPFPYAALQFLHNIPFPYNKVKGCLFVCLSVPKDLANRWTDRVLLNRVASHRSRKGL